MRTLSVDTVIKYSPEKAWQAAVIDLELGMPRTAFNTYVKPIRLVSFENDTFLIGCMNIFSRDWLEEHLTKTLQHFLSGVMNREIEIRFTVCDKDMGEDVLIEADAREQLDQDDDPVEIGVQYDSIRNILLEPGRVVRLPVYSLRWLPYVGAQTIFLVMGLWQEYYLTSGGKPGKGNYTVSVRAERVCQWAGISRAQFFRQFQAGNPIEWFARKIETGHQVDHRNGRIKKSSNRYDLYDSPLTPGDAQDLKSFLLAQGIQERPTFALLSALKTDPKEILHYPTRLPPDGFDKMSPQYLTVQKVVMELVGQGYNAELAGLTDQLADLLLARGDFILVSWYFLKNWLPILGSDAAMFVLLLRDQCYFNKETGEMRDEVWMVDGFEGICTRLGIKNPRIVANWFPARIERGKRKTELTDRTHKELSRRHILQELLRLFVVRINHRINSSGSYAWKFKVQRIDPLTPNHQAIQQVASSLLTRSEDQQVLDELYSWTEKISIGCLLSAHQGCEIVKNESDVVGGLPAFSVRLSELTKDCSETLNGIFDDCFDTVEIEANDCFETLLKILKSFKGTFKNSRKDQETTSCQSFLNFENKPAHQVVEGTDSNKVWSLERLLLRVDKKTRLVLLDQEKSATPFISWVIQGAAQANILNPSSLAISRLKENPGIGAGGASERLAALPPRELARLVDQYLGLRSPSDQNWRMLFSQAKRDRIHLLADLLGLDLHHEQETNGNRF
jgi:hypothetical protein